jgi:hypothetical protein
MSFRLRYPSAIARREILVFVESFEDRATRLLAHIGEEIFKRCKPYVAHSDAPIPVSDKPAIVRVCASVFRRRPRSVCASALFIRHRVAVLVARFAELLVMEATTRGSPTAEKLRRAYQRSLAALAFAFPTHDRTAIGIERTFSALDYLQPTERFATQIFEGAHDVIL